MLNLPHQADLDALAWNAPTVGQLTEQLYPGLTFDTALPQQWVDLVTNRGFDPRGHVVWGYPNGSLYGQPYPLTAEAALALARLTLGLN